MEDKPIAIALYDAKATIINTINSIKLSPCLLEPILKDCYEQVSRLARQELETERMKYNNSLVQDKDSDE